MQIKRVLIANRGEIANRIIATLKKRNVESVAIYHEDEGIDSYASNADYCVNIGSGALAENFLNVDKLIEITKEYNCDAIHPGYGFLSENAKFAEVCVKNKIEFIGPSANAIAAMGNKMEAKAIAKKAGVPVLESTILNNINEINLETLKYPVLLKATAGGGGRGMKIIRSASEFESAFQQAKHEAKQYFGNDELMIEPYLEKARHIEVQILGDKHGNVSHLLERECSLQRNYQKVVEEAPAVSIKPELKQQLHTAAINFAKALNYHSAGTVELLVSGNDFYFLEMNTRIQVEHPVTELITGIDLVEQQIRIAEGELLPYKLKDIEAKGHAIEVRLCAEKPEEDFQPSVGKITYCSWPENIRFDSFIKQGINLTTHFDSMLGKIIVYGESRSDAIKKIERAIEETHVHGIDTNLKFLGTIVRQEFYKQNDIHTKTLEERHTELIELNQTAPAYEKYIAAFVLKNFTSGKRGWSDLNNRYLARRLSVRIDEQNYAVLIQESTENYLLISIDGVSFTINKIRIDKNKLSFNINSREVKVIYSEVADGSGDYVEIKQHRKKLDSPHLLRMAHLFLNNKKKSGVDNKNERVTSPLFGKVLSLKVSPEALVKKGDVLLTIESMKTENHIICPFDGKVDKIFVEEGESIKENIDLITINPIS